MSNVVDPIADMLTRIRNAYGAKHSKVDIPGSNVKKQIVNILLQHNYIKNFVEVEDGRQGLLRLYLRYDSNGRSVVSGLSRISKSGLRVYANKEELKKMSRLMGISILSTSKGILTHHQAMEEGVGGEVMCKIW